METVGSDDSVQHIVDLVLNLENNPPSADPEEITEGDILTYLSSRHQQHLYGKRYDQTNDNSATPDSCVANISHYPVICDDRFTIKYECLNISHKIPLLHDVGRPQKCVRRSDADLDGPSTSESCQVYDNESISNDVQPSIPDNPYHASMLHQFEATTCAPSIQGETGSCYSYVMFLMGLQGGFTNLPQFVFEEEAVSFQREFGTLIECKIELIGNILNELFKSPELVDLLMSSQSDDSDDQFCHQTDNNLSPQPIDGGSDNSTCSSEPTNSESTYSPHPAKRTLGENHGDRPMKLPKGSHDDTRGLHSIMTVNSSLDTCTSTQKPPVAYINDEINPNSAKPPLNFSEESINLGFTSVSKDATSSDPEIKQDYSSPTPNPVPFDEVNLHMGYDQHTCYHDDVIKWKHFPRYWPFVRGIHRSPVNSPHKGQ